MKSLVSLPTIDPLLFSRLLRRNVVDKVVLVGKLLCVLIALFFLQQLIQDILATRTKLASADLALRNRETIPPPKPKNSIKNDRDYSVIVRDSLLGTIQTQAKASNQPAAKPVSTIPMGLIGVYIQDGVDPYAIIEDKKKNTQEVFMIDEMIFGEAKLKKILSDRVEIERNGQIEQLIMEEFGGKSSGGETKGGITVAEGNHFIVDESEIDKALENLPLVLTQARAVPYFKDGVSVGLRLFAIKSESIFDKLGFKNGDILKAVNGNSLGDLTQAMKLFETLKQERNLSVRVERTMQEQDFKYEIR